MGSDFGATSPFLSSSSGERGEAQGLWRSRGISSVPAVVVEGKYLISGGQAAAVFEEALCKIAAE